MKPLAASNKLPPAAPSSQPQRVKVGWAETTRFQVPIPKQEKKRLAVLQTYQILDTPPEPHFDDITTLAAQVCEAPIALLSLVDSDRQWFKSKVGINVCETSRDLAFCAHAIMQKDLFIVEDAASDKRFACNPLVTSDPRIRFYAGAPLIAPNDLILGTLCVIDRVPRKLTREQVGALQALSRLAMVQLELRRETTNLKHQLLEQQLAERNLPKKLQAAEAVHRRQKDLIQKLNHQVQTTARAILAITDQTRRTKLTARHRACLDTVRSSAIALLKLSDEIAGFAEL